MILFLFPQIKLPFIFLHGYGYYMILSHDKKKSQVTMTLFFLLGNQDKYPQGIHSFPSMV